MNPFMVMATVMHQQVHQRTRREQQPGQVGQNVRAVLNQQQEASDHGEHREYPLRLPARSAIWKLDLIVHVDLSRP
jgi:hypothetical protein